MDVWDEWADRMFVGPDRLDVEARKFVMEREAEFRAWLGDEKRMEIRTVPLREG